MANNFSCRTLVAIAMILIIAFTSSIMSLAPTPVKSVPGFNGDIKFAQYSGFVTVNATAQRNLFYWFVESQSNPSTDPVVLWMNGGPGCSSLDGFVTEHGPFLLNDDGTTLSANDYSWNKRANMIYLESPFEVGYSYSGQKDYIWNDVKSADDVVTFLRIFFFEMFPQFAKNSFFIAAESYGGHYGPTSAVAVLRSGLPFNLKGFIVANGIMDDREDTNSVPMFMYQHSLISKTDYENGLAACKGDFYANQNLRECGDVISDYYTAIVGVNPYDIYGKCVGDVGPFDDVKTTAAPSTTDVLKQNGWYKTLTKKQPYDSKIHPLFTLSQRVGSGAPCLAYKPQEYWFNLPQVKAALNANSMPAGHKWQMCNDVVNGNYNRTYTTMIPFYQELLSKGVRGLFVTGDVDLAVNSLGSQSGVYAAMKGMNAYMTTKFTSWSVDKQVTGFYQIWKAGSTTMTFKTVKGAGHMIPMKFPALSQQYFYDFIFA